MSGGFMKACRIHLKTVQRMWTILYQNNGITGFSAKLYRMDEVKDGKLVGVDKYGNKYFENNRYFFGRNRWVEYAPYYGLNYDGSQIPPEWFGWMHYKTDYLPSEDPGRPKYKWMEDHTENLSGTTGQYVPYSTSRPKIEHWTPKTWKKPELK